MLHGCKVSKRAPSVSHLLFADDSFFFFQTSVPECEVMNDILACYERDSDQAVNLQVCSTSYPFLLHEYFFCCLCLSVRSFRE